MGLFDKKYCDICGAHIKLLGNKKLEDGNCCKECASKLSPWFNERRHSTVDSIKEQLAYREANLEEVASFNVTHTIGDGTKILIDEDQKKFIITSSSKWRDSNPDVIPFSAVTGCDTRIEEYKSEDTTRDNDGNEMSYVPPKFSYSYNFQVTVHVNNPYFDELNFRLNSSSVSEEFTGKLDQPAEVLAGNMNRPVPGANGLQGRPAPGPGASSPQGRPAPGAGGPQGRPAPGPDGHMSHPQASPSMVPVGHAIAPASSELSHGNAYLNYENALAEVKEIFTGIREEHRAAAAQAAAPKLPVKCPNCGATSVPDDKGCCEYCGSPLN